MHKPSPEISVYPDRLYSPNHEWLLAEGREARIGITRYPLPDIGVVQAVEISGIASNLKQGAIFGLLHCSDKTYELFMPVGGVIFEINRKVIHAPLIINADPYGWGWLVRVFIADPDELTYLLAPHTYREQL